MLFRWIVFSTAMLLSIGALGTPASAAPTYEVTGVSADDVLNIRQAPRASARKVGEYGPRDKGIRIFRRDGNWALTGRSDPGQPDGWVNTRYLKVTTATARLELPISCLGTEPFWNLTVQSNRRAVYTDPETTERPYRVSEFRRSGRGATMRLGDDDSMSIAAESCSDGMSDNQYPYSVRILHPDGRELNGCCG